MARNSNDIEKTIKHMQVYAFSQVISNTQVSSLRHMLQYSMVFPFYNELNDTIYYIILQIFFLDFLATRAYARILLDTSFGSVIGTLIITLDA